MTEQLFHDENSAQPVGKQRGRWQWTGLIAAPFILAIPIAWLLLTPSQQVIPNLGGSTAYLVATTYGTHHRCLDGPRWQHLLLPLVGISQAEAWGWRVGEYTHHKPVLVFWITWKSAGRITVDPRVEQITNEHHSSIPELPI